MEKWSVSIGWKFYLAYGIFMAAIGFFALVVPREIAVGEFESFTGTVWAEFTEANAKVGRFIEHVYRGLGCMALLAGFSFTLMEPRLLRLDFGPTGQLRESLSLSVCDAIFMGKV